MTLDLSIFILALDPRRLDAHHRAMSPRRNFFMILAYDGGDFLGWQRLSGADRSVQATVESALSRILGEPIEIVGAGRTDRGVHAEGQAASFHSHTALAPQAIASALEISLPGDVACLSCREVDPRFHARFKVKSKLYRYRLLVGPHSDPFLRRYSHRVPDVLDLRAMRSAAALFEGERDFRAFTNAKDGEGFIRRIDSVRVEAHERFVDLLFEAPGFLFNQVRLMAASILEVGRENLDPERIAEALRIAPNTTADDREGRALGADAAFPERQAGSGFREQGRRGARATGGMIREESALPGALGAHGLCLAAVRYGPGDLELHQGASGAFRSSDGVADHGDSRPGGPRFDPGQANRSGDASFSGPRPVAPGKGGSRREARRKPGGHFPPSSL